MFVLEAGYGFISKVNEFWFSSNSYMLLQSIKGTRSIAVSRNSHSRRKILLSKDQRPSPSWNSSFLFSAAVTVTIQVPFFTRIISYLSARGRAVVFKAGSSFWYRSRTLRRGTSLYCRAGNIQVPERMIPCFSGGIRVLRRQWILIRMKLLKRPVRLF